ncbi:molecular chaperone DnaK [bacterium]|nr:molecular chaperone DnaK [bacterium]
MSSRSTVIGIDLGTTNSCVAIIEGGVPKVIENDTGARTTPSVVGLTDSERLVGELAKRQAVTNPQNTFFGVKRLIGRTFNDPAIEHQKLPYKVVKADNGDAWVEAQGKKMAPQQISAYVLMKMKKIAEDYLGHDVTDAVITVPAYFNDSQRQATKDAGRIAGLNVLRIINEPTAAALAYGIDKKKKDAILAVYDLGGGTFDVSIIELSDIDGETQFEVLATNGDTHLGGEDFDEAVMEYLIAEFKKETGIDLHKDPLAIQRLKEAAEKAKIELSSREQTDINLPYITADASGPKHMNYKISRAKLESLVIDLINRSIEPCKIALKDAGKTIDQIDEILLVGGQTRMPKVRQAVQDFFNKEPRTIRVFQGEREIAVKNKLLGKFDLADIPSAPRGMPQIEVSFDIDSNGILNVSAQDKASGKKQSIIVKASSGLSEQEIQAMVDDAKKHEEEDKHFQELVHARNSADSIVHTVERTLKDLGDKIPESDKKDLEQAVASLKDLMDKEDKAAIEERTEHLSSLYTALTEKFSGEAGAQHAHNQTEAKGHQTQEDVVDAEFDEVNKR